MKEQAQNRVLDPDDCEREPFAGVNASIRAHIAREKEVSGEQLSYVYPSKVWEYPWSITRHAFPKGEIVLDAGCGVSALPIHLALGGATVIAIDNDRRWLDMEARAVRFHRVPVVPVLMAMEDLAFPDASFDRVYCISVLEHLPVENQPKAMREMARVLRPGGILYLTVDYDERERRSDDDVVYDRLAMQRYGVAPSGLEIEGTTDWTRPDWEEHHHRMRAFKYHTFAAMAVALRKPPGEGPESAEAIAARRARVADARFKVAIDLGSARESVASLAEKAVRAAALGLERAHLHAPPSASSAEALRAVADAGLVTSLTLLSFPRSSADGESDEGVAKRIASEGPEALARALVGELSELDAARMAWLDVCDAPEALTERGALRESDVHALLRALSLAAHERWPELPVSASARAPESLVRGLLDGTALDVYATRAGIVDEAARARSEADPEAGPIPAASWLSAVRDCVLVGLEVPTRALDDGDTSTLAAALRLARARGHREVVLGPHTSAALLALGARDPSALAPVRETWS